MRPRWIKWTCFMLIFWLVSCVSGCAIAEDPETAVSDYANDSESAETSEVVSAASSEEIVVVPQLLAENDACKLWKTGSRVSLQLCWERSVIDQIYAYYSTHCSTSTGYIQFSSMEEMKKTVEEASFTNAQLRKMLMMWWKDEKGDIVMCDPENLWVPVVPDTMVGNEKVELRGPTYLRYYYGTEPGIAIARFSICDNENIWEAWKKDKVPENSVLEGSKILSEKEVIWEDVPYRQIVFDTGVMIGMVRETTLTDGDNSLLIYEHYQKLHKENGEIVDEDTAVPYMVFLFGKVEGEFFYVSMNTDQRPTPAELRQYTIKPYEASKD